MKRSFVSALLFSLSIGSAFSSDHPLMKLHYSKLGDINGESGLHTRECEFAEKFYMVTTFTGNESSQSAEEADYDVEKLKSLIARANKEKLHALPSDVCSNESMILEVFIDHKKITLEEMIECNSHRLVRIGPASTELKNLATAACPALN